MAIMLDAANSFPTAVPTSSQNVTIGATSTQSTVIVATAAGLPRQRYLVRIAPTGNCRIAVGANPTATATSPLYFANIPEYLDVGRGDRIAVIQDGTATGTCNITLMNIFVRGELSSGV